MPAPPEGHRQRLRERFLTSDGKPLEDRHALELLLTYAIPRRDVLPLADALLGRFGSISGVLNATQDDLRSVAGIGDASVLLLKLVARFAAAEAPKPKGRPRPAEKASEPPGLFRPPVLPQQALPQVVEPPPRTESPKPAEANSVLAEPKPVTVKPAPSPPAPALDKAKRTVSPALRRPRTGLFCKGLLKDAVECLPKLPDTDSIDEIRDFLREGGLHYSGAQTRHRVASYIISRLFPAGTADRAIRWFARTLPGHQALRDACLYRFMKAEPFLQQIMLNLFVPAAGAGTLARGNLRDYISSRFPSAKPNTTKSCWQATAEIIQGAGLGTVTKTHISVGFRDVCLESFAFVVHSEFPEPGMYEVSKVEHGDIFRAMLWRPDALLPAVYELRNRGWISKVSEIDSVRQFTTRHGLDQIVDRIASEGGRR